MQLKHENSEKVKIFIKIQQEFEKQKKSVGSAWSKRIKFFKFISFYIGKQKIR